jgi:hypothetical protein
MSRASGRTNADGLIGGNGCILALFARAAASAGHISPDEGIGKLRPVCMVARI